MRRTGSWPMSSIAWSAGSVTNLTNRVYRVHEDDTTVPEGQVTSVHAPPRWFRLSVSMKFGGAKWQDCADQRWYCGPARFGRA
jgi:hypothetical protein